MKKACGFLLVFVFLLSLTGCGKSDTATDSGGAIMAFSADDAASQNEGELQIEEDVLFIATPTPSPTPAPSPTPTPSPTLPPYTVEQVDAQKGYVTKSGVNIRSGPHTTYDVLTEVDSLTPVTVTGKSEDWYQVKLGELLGFMNSEFISFGPTPTPTPKPYTVTKMSSTSAFINAGSVNFRTGPGRSYDTIAEVERYEKVTINGVSGDWYRVKYNKKTGYMLKTYVKIGLSPKGYESVGKYTQADVLLLSQICYKEAARGDAEGYKAVASVILNRLKSSKYPNSIERIVFQGNGAQFSPAEDENKLRLTKPSEACVKAVREVLASGSILPSNVMYFRTAGKGTDWGSVRVYYATYGGNCFFS